MAIPRSDADLIRICLEGREDEVTDDVLSAIRQRSTESPLVREAVRVSPHPALRSTIVDSKPGSVPDSDSLPSGRSTRVWRLATVGGLIAAFAVVLIVVQQSKKNADFAARLKLDAASPDTIREPAPSASPQRTAPIQTDAPADTHSAGTRPTIEMAVPADTAATATAADAIENAPVTMPPEAAQTSVEPVIPAVIVEAVPDEAPPWAESLNLEIPPRAFADIAWKLPGMEQPDEFRPDQFRQWCESLPGRPFQAQEERVGNRLFTRFDGLTRLRAPWVDDAVLRLGIYDVERCSLYVWDGNRGLQFKFFRHRTPNVWAVHRVTRTAEAAPPTEGELLTTDCGRWQRSTFGAFDVRWEDGWLRMVRGDVALLSVPWESRPREIILDGKFKVRQLSMFRTDPLPAEVLEKPIFQSGSNRLPTSSPGELSWTLSEPDTSRVQPLNADGMATGVELSSTELTKKTARAWFPIPDTGLCEFIFRVESADAGTGLFFGREDGTPVFQIGWVWDPTAGLSGILFQQGGQNQVEHRFDRDAWPPPWSGESQWLRVVPGYGTVSVWISPDGANWGWVGDSPARRPWEHWQTVGLFAQPQASRSIRLRSIEAREFSALASLADADLLKQVDIQWFAPLALLDPGAWLHSVVRHQPDNVDPRAWRTACAVATLRAVPAHDLGVFLTNGLLADGLPAESGQSVLARQLLNEAAQLTDVFDHGRGVQWTQLGYEAAWYEVRARHHHRLATGNPMSRADAGSSADSPTARPQDAAPADSPSATAMRFLLAAPFWTSFIPSLTPQDTARHELTALVESGQSSAARDLIDRIVFWNTNSHPGHSWWSPVDPLYLTVVWSELSAHDDLDSEQRAARFSIPGRWKTALAPQRHPLAQPVSKEAYNVMAEFQAAISGQAFGDACQVISSAASADLLGLLPDTRDNRLLISFPGAVALAMEQSPRLRESMNEKFGAIGRLRVRQAMEAGDARQVEAATVQFFGTPAAAESEQWLGDRALAAGRFAQARGHYQRALEGFHRHSTLAVNDTRGLSARLQLTSAFQGQLGPSVTATAPSDPVSIGTTTLTSAQLDPLLKELTGRSPSPGAGKALSGEATLSPDTGVTAARLPEPGVYTVQTASRYDGDLGEHAGQSAPHGVDWVARQLGTVTDGTQALLSNRFQINCLDLVSGQTLWSTQLGGEHGHAHYWPMLPMRPLLTPGSVFARRLTKNGPELVCLDRQNGQLRWRQKPDWTLLSDPFLVRGRLQCFAQEQVAAGPSVLYLLTVHADSGTVLEAVPVLNLLDSGQTPVPNCQPVASDGLIHFTTEGVAACCNSDGQLLWVRREPVIPVTLDSRMRPLRAWTPPIVDSQHVFLSQPESPLIECLDAETGRQTWNIVEPDLTRMIGVVGHSLIFETPDGLRAVDSANGAWTWSYQAADLLDAILIGPDQTTQADKTPEQSKTARRVLVTRKVASPDGNRQQFTPTLIWLDASTGLELDRAPLDSLRDLEPYLGPFLVTADRTWVLSGTGRQTAHRDILELSRSDTDHPRPVVNQSMWAGWHPEFRLATFSGNRAAQPDLARVNLSKEVRDGLEAACPGWLLTAPPQRKEAGLRTDFRGRQNILLLHLSQRGMTDEQRAAQAATPVNAVRLIREVTIPAQTSQGLKLFVGHDAGQTWLLTVDAGRERLHSSVIDDETARDGWIPLHISAPQLAGRTIQMIITCALADSSKEAWIGLSDITPPK